MNEQKLEIFKIIEKWEIYSIDLPSVVNILSTGTRSDVTELLNTQENLTSDGDAITSHDTLRICPSPVAKTLPGSSVWAQTGASAIIENFIECFWFSEEINC